MKKLSVLLTVLLATGGFCDEEDILPRPPKPIRGENELARLVRDTRIGDPQQFKNLTVFPLFTAGRGRNGYWTLDQALAKGLMKISEKGEGSVPDLLVENTSDEPVFLLAGEIVRGGKQNRVISQDILVPPRSGLINVSVFCVEHGRWTRQTQYFVNESEMAHGTLRQEMSAPSVSQQQVWSEVARKADAIAPSAAAGTGYLGKIYADAEVKGNVDEYARAITMPSDANGMAVVICGRVVGVEMFCDSETFNKLRDKLLRSYAVDAIEYGRMEKSYGGRETVERFLNLAQRARLVPKQTIGLGRLLGVEGTGLYGSVLTWHEQKGAYGVVHASVFAEGRPVEVTPPHPPVVPFER